MKDIFSLNYQYLLVARELANSNAGNVLTGLPKTVLSKLAEMSIEEVEELAKTSGLCLIGLRFNEAQMMKILNMPSTYRASYAMSISAEQK